MQHAAAEHQRRNAALAGMLARKPGKASRQRIVKRPRPRRWCRLPAQPRLPEGRQIEPFPAKRHLHRVLKVFRFCRQRLQLAGGLPFIAKLLWRAAERAGHRVKQPPAG